MEKKIQTEHGIVCTMPNDTFGYFGWPTVTRMDDGILVVGSSGLRTQHVCPYGKSVLFFSHDNGSKWSKPSVVNDTPLDDRDVGVLNLGGTKLLMSWFSSDSRKYPGTATWQEKLDKLTDDMVNKWLGSWIRLSDDCGRTWGEPIKLDINTPHGPIRLASGNLLYLGKVGFVKGELVNGDIMAWESADSGKTWSQLGKVPLCKGTESNNYYEPHVVELPSGKLVGMVRFEVEGFEEKFTMYQTKSEDGGRTWTPMRPTNVYGSPPHLLRHSSGVLICVYGWRKGWRKKHSLGQRVMISYDEGTTWDSDYVLRDDGPDWDLGYPSSVELSDGSLFTVYYQKLGTGEKTSLLWSCWNLPE